MLEEKKIIILDLDDPLPTFYRKTQREIHKP